VGIWRGAGQSKTITTEDTEENVALRPLRALFSAFAV
jgi:hypothetical protein